MISNQVFLISVVSGILVLAALAAFTSIPTFWQINAAIIIGIIVQLILRLFGYLRH